VIVAVGIGDSGVGLQYLTILKIVLDNLMFDAIRKNDE